MTDTLPLIAPSQASQMRTELAVSETRFGNGYISRRRTGLAPEQRIWSLVWSALSQSQYQTLDTFFVSHDGTTPFYWTDPAVSRTRLFICQSWQTRVQAANLFEMTARLFPYQ